MDKSDLFPCLWFEKDALLAAEFYCKIFPNSRIVSSNHLVVIFELNESKFMALNGGDRYTFTPAVSYVISCETQEEIDHYWNALGADGRYDNCGWLQDKYGFSWQVVPKILGILMQDSEKAPRVVQAFMKMKKLDINELMNA